MVAGVEASRCRWRAPVGSWEPEQRSGVGEQVRMVPVGNWEVLGPASMGSGRRSERRVVVGRMAVAGLMEMVGTGTAWTLAFWIQVPPQPGWLPRRWPPTVRMSSSLVEWSNLYCFHWTSTRN